MPTNMSADTAADRYNNICLPSIQINGKTATDHNNKPDILNTVENIYHCCKTLETVLIHRIYLFQKNFSVWYW